VRSSVNPGVTISDRRNERLADTEHLSELRSWKTAHANGRDVIVRELYVGTKAGVVGGSDNLEMVRVDAESHETQMVEVHTVGDGAMNGFVCCSVSGLVVTPKVDSSVATGVLSSGSGLVSRPNVARGFITHVLRLPLKEWVAAKRASDVFGRKLGWFSTAATASLDVHSSILSRHKSLCLTT
jgi:hypothetical protein